MVFASMGISMWGASPVLAQMGKGLTDEDRSEIFFWLTVLIIVAVITSVAGFIVYRKVKKADERTEEEQDFSLSQMRRLYEAGELSHEEYTQLREKILTATKRSMLGENDAMSRVAKTDLPPSPPLPPGPPTPPTPPVAHDEPPTSEELQPPESDEPDAR